MDALFNPRESPAAGSVVPGDDGKPVPDSVVEQAVGWYVRLSSGLQTAQDRAEFDRWHAAHGDHARAWQRLEVMGGRLRGSTNHVAPELSRAALASAVDIVPARRRALRTLMWVGTGGTALYLVQEQVPWRAHLATAMADERTATGERRNIVLADGTRLLLNTATAVDIRFDARERRVVLRNGEIMVTTAPDLQGRPFLVSTREGSLTPVGTRFTVRRDDALAGGITQLAVVQGVVAVRTVDAPSVEPTLVRAGQQTRFKRTHIDGIEPLHDAALAWTDDVLTAEGTPLGEFIADLDRYRLGRLRCTPEVAQLRITGSWPLDGNDPTERILASLERQLPVRVNRVSRYWVTVSSK